MLTRFVIGFTEAHGGGAKAVPPLWQTPDAQERVDEDAEGASADRSRHTGCGACSDWLRALGPEVL